MCWWICLQKLCPPPVLSNFLPVFLLWAEWVSIPHNVYLHEPYYKVATIFHSFSISFFSAFCHGWIKCRSVCLFDQWESWGTHKNTKKGGNREEDAVCMHWATLPRVCVKVFICSLKCCLFLVINSPGSSTIAVITLLRLVSLEHKFKCLHRSTIV